MTLGEAKKALLWEIAGGKAVKCPCCRQRAKMYSRHIDGNMARGLIALHNHSDEWVHVPTLANNLKLGNQLGGALAKLRYWDLLEEELSWRPDGGRAGYWRITSLGVAFVERRTKVPKYAKIYNNLVIDLYGEDIGIDDALGEKFNYDELMNR